MISNASKFKVYYLTIQEGYVEAGESQRRPGLHVDSLGKVDMINISQSKVKDDLFSCDEGQGASQQFKGHRWGMGCAHFTKRMEDLDDYDWRGRDSLVIHDGIYMASSVSNSCKVWNAKVSPDIIGRLVSFL